MVDTETEIHNLYLELNNLSNLIDKLEDLKNNKKYKSCYVEIVSLLDKLYPKKRRLKKSLDKLVDEVADTAEILADLDLEDIIR